MINAIKAISKKYKVLFPKIVCMDKDKFLIQIMTRVKSASPTYNDKGECDNNEGTYIVEQSFYLADANGLPSLDEVVAEHGYRDENFERYSTEVIHDTP